MMPKVSAARAAVSPPPSSKDCNEPMGASITGTRKSTPNSLRRTLTDETSVNTRAFSASRSKASRLRLSEVSVSAPPTRKSQSPRDSFARA